MAPSLDLLTLDNPLLKTYAFYMSILTIKILLVAPLTSFHRIKNATFISTEDIVFINKKAKVGYNEDVERVRRAHRNDLENIPVFMIVSLLYILSGPNVFLATMLMRIFTIVRIVHTAVYAVANGPHKFRGMSWGIGFIITVFMAVSLVWSFTEDL